MGARLTAECRRCGAAFEKRTVAIYCPPCRPKAGSEQATRWWAAHHGKQREARRKWLAAHPDAMAVARKSWRDRHPEKVKSYRLITKRRYPELNRAYVRARKARQRANSVVPFTPEQLQQRLAFYGTRCWMCGGSGETIDHVIPLAKGGPHILANLRPACLSCNSRKGDRWPFKVAA